MPADSFAPKRRSSSSSTIHGTSTRRSSKALSYSSMRSSRAMSIAAPGDGRASSSKTFSFAVHAPTNRTALVPAVATILGVAHNPAEEIVEAFDEYVAKPLQSNLAKKTGRDLAKRNPMIYTARGTTTVAEWVDRALADWETSAIEGHLG